MRCRVTRGVPLWILAFVNGMGAGWGSRGNLGGILMPTLTIEYSTESERLALEQLLGYFTDLNRLAQEAPDGTVLAACEKHALDQGRKLLRTTLGAALGSRIEKDEQKGGAPAPARRRTPGAPKDRTPERL
ncbi:hypothetical protein C1280_35160 [Gemmata obscuriglobus]|uniref:Uncharacterized protein n=1 Tax=Gemmata obscuriglobus TaxID=114 RepID=A0A2Z3H6U3_9BACT|nr:hypothetical protein C1280_35160 [Gemmata obscuriglobus]